MPYVLPRKNKREHWPETNIKIGPACTTECTTETTQALSPHTTMRAV